MSKAKQVAAPHIEIAWLKGEAKGTTDVFSSGEFSKAVQGAARQHFVRGPKGGWHTARFRLHTAGLRASLDYKVDKKFNTHRGMKLGVLELRFSDSSRTVVREMKWDGELQPANVARVDYRRS